MSTVMNPSSVPFTWKVKPGERLEIYGGFGNDYDGYDGGYNCATLTLNESMSITMEIDMASAQHFTVSPGFNPRIYPGEDYFMSDTTPSETWTQVAGEHRLDFDCTIFARTDVDNVSGTLIVRVKSGQTTIGTFNIIYTISSSTAQSITIYSTKDTYVRESLPNANYGSGTALYVQTMEDFNMRALLEFPLNNIPQGAWISNARVYFMTGDTVGPFPLNQTFSRILGSWEELSATWNNQPVVTSLNALIFSIPYNSGGAHMDFDVTQLVRDALQAGGNFGLQIRFTQEDADVLQGKQANMFYVPREGASQWRPYLIIEYSQPIQGTVQIHAQLLLKL